ncbi:MAG: FGGY-family carbohydrate kinase, partial [Actinocatenispora sp.]
DPYAALAALLRGTVPPGGVPAPPGELVVEPYPAGRGAPAPDPRRRLAVHGMTVHSGPADLAGALLTAMGCQVRWIVEELATACRTAPGSVTVYGGALRLPGWRERRAAINPWPTVRAPHPETVSLGAACLAASAGGSDLTPPPPIPVRVGADQLAAYDGYYRERFRATVG